MSNSTSDNEVVVHATVTEALPNAMFRVRINNSKNPPQKVSDDTNSELVKNQPEEFIAYLSGRMKFNRIKVLVGDNVQVLLDPYGGKGRIIKRG